MIADSQKVLDIIGSLRYGLVMNEQEKQEMANSIGWAIRAGRSNSDITLWVTTMYGEFINREDARSLVMDIRGALVK